MTASQIPGPSDAADTPPVGPGANPRLDVLDDRYLTPAEVAALMRVHPKTVSRWANAGKLSMIRTIGGHRRYRESEVRALLEGSA